MKQTRPGCQLVAPSASQWDGKAFVLGGNLRSALCAAQAFLCTCKHVCCLGTEETNAQMYNLHLKKKISYIFTEILFLLCVHHRTLSAYLNGRDVKEKKMFTSVRIVLGCIEVHLSHCWSIPFS